MTHLFHFILGGLVSFVGSLPMGLINLAVAETAISRGMRAALLLAFGAVLIEFGQILIALFFADWFFNNEERMFWMKVAGTPIFMILGLWYLLKKPTPPVEKHHKPLRKNAFLHGAGLSAVNMLAVPFWLVYGAWLQAQGWLEKKPILMTLFALGAVAGTFGLLVLYARLGRFVLKRAGKIAMYASKVIGVVLLCLGIYQVISLILA